MKRILLLPFCLSRQTQMAAKAAAAEEGYTVVVAHSTAKALAPNAHCRNRVFREGKKGVGRPRLHESVSMDETHSQGTCQDN